MPSSPEVRRENYIKDRERHIARVREWRENNSAWVRQYSAERRSQRKPVEYVLYWNARNRAKAHGISFDLEIADIHVPEFCPILGLRLVVGTGHAKPNSPSLDRIDPSRGYVKGNIAVISHRANTIKSNATVAELEAVCAFMRGAHVT